MLATSVDSILNYHLGLDCAETVSTANSFISNINGDLNDLISLTDCPPLYSVWNDAINIGLCDHLVTGIFSIWVSQFIASGALFFTICFISVLYQYFGSSWSISPSRPLPPDVERHLELVPMVHVTAIRDGDHGLEKQQQEVPEVVVAEIQQDHHHHQQHHPEHHQHNEGHSHEVEKGGVTLL